MERTLGESEELVAIFLLRPTYDKMIELAVKKNRSVAWVFAQALAQYIRSEDSDECSNS